MKSLQPYIKSLLVSVERYHTRSIRTTVDFEALSITIEQQTSERISASTLKRLWGYVSDKHQPRRYTLDVLSMYVGLKDFDAFCAKIDADPENGSNFFRSFTIASTDLSAGDKLEFGWSPDRYIQVLYLGDNLYEVIEAQVSKLMIGDKFRCVTFILDYPLYLPYVERGGEILPSFVAGNKGGLIILATL